MPNPPATEVLIRPPDRAADAQAPLPLAADGVARWVWESRFGAMLIEVVGEQVRVNGEPVEPAPPPGEAAPR
jgi:hypothetical protein